MNHTLVSILARMTELKVERKTVDGILKSVKKILYQVLEVSG